MYSVSVSTLTTWQCGSRTEGHGASRRGRDHHNWNNREPNLPSLSQMKENKSELNVKSFVVNLLGMNMWEVVLLQKKEWDWSRWRRRGEPGEQSVSVTSGSCAALMGPDTADLPLRGPPEVSCRTCVQVISPCGRLQTVWGLCAGSRSRCCSLDWRRRDVAGEAPERTQTKNTLILSILSVFI